MAAGWLPGKSRERDLSTPASSTCSSAEFRMSAWCCLRSRSSSAVTFSSRFTTLARAEASYVRRRRRSLTNRTVVSSSGAAGARVSEDKEISLLNASVSLAIVASRDTTASRNWFCWRATSSRSAAFSISSWRNRRISARFAAPTRWEHMHITESFAYQIFGRERMREDRPIGARNFRALDGVGPQVVEIQRISRFTELADRCSMTSIQGLLQELGGMIPAARQADGPAVQFVIRILVAPSHLGASADMPELGRGHACANDRTMEIAANLPNAPPPGHCNGGWIGCAPAAQHGDGSRISRG